MNLAEINKINKNGISECKKLHYLIFDEINETENLLTEINVHLYLNGSPFSIIIKPNKAKIKCNFEEIELSVIRTKTEENIHTIYTYRMQIKQKIKELFGSIVLGYTEIFKVY